MVNPETHSITPESFERFGELLRYLRLRARLTQRELSIAVGYNFAQISRLESGQRLPDPTVIAATFVPALDLAHEPAWAGRLLMLAENATRQALDHTLLAVRDVALAAPDPDQPALPAELPLLLTKLFAPPVRPDAVLRSHLLQQLDAALTVPLTLISAGAGFGKTTLLASWLAQRMKPGRGDQSAVSPRIPHPSSVAVAWLSLDAQDNEPATFLQYLVAALRTILPGIGSATSTLIHAPQLPPMPQLLTPLLNDLAALPGPALLILDDYHLLSDGRIHEAVLFLVEHMPTELHLAIATRLDPPLPLARLRARRMLVELRSAELRFTSDEARTFLLDTMAVDVSHGEAAQLEARTEGWPAGLQLAALALRGRADRTGFLASFTGSNPYVADYLAAEVLGQLSAHLRRFVLQTAILDRLCGPLCDAVLDLVPDSQPGAHEDSYSRITLGELEQRNLFLVPLDGAGRWYRYHHLFADVLRAHLAQGLPRAEVARLHERAGAWFARQRLYDEAIGHWLRASAPHEAARLIEQQAEELLIQSEMTTLRRWIERLPQAVVTGRRRLALAYAGVQLAMGNFPAVEPLLQAGERAAPAETDEQEDQTLDRGWLDAVEGYTAAMRSILARAQNDLAAATSYAHTALRLLDQRFIFMRSSAQWNLGMVRWMQGDLAGADAIFEQVWTSSQRADQLYAFLVTSANLGQVRMSRGRLRHAAQIFRDALHHVAGQKSRIPSEGLVQVGMGELLREWNDLEGALRHLGEGAALGKLFGNPDVLVAAHVGIARVRLAQGDREGARAALAESDSVAPGLVLSLDESPRYRLLVALGEHDRAAAWAQRAGVQGAIPASQGHENEQIVLARVLLAQGAYAEALPLLERLAIACEASGRGGALIEALTLQALALKASGREEQATDALARALALAEPEGYARVFLDEGTEMAQLLGLLARRQHSAPLQRSIGRLLAFFDS